MVEKRDKEHKKQTKTKQIMDEQPTTNKVISHKQSKVCLMHIKLSQSKQCQARSFDYYWLSANYITLQNINY